jgi:ABC-type nickel/cobalt efflux system permease component RcnA
MKKALLILLMLVLPWQSLAAMERNLAHTVSGSEHGTQYVVEHMAEHAGHILHHHDDDGDGATHVDDSEKSAQHLADYEQAGSMNLLFATIDAPSAVAVTLLPLAVWRDPYRTRSILPLLRPPRLPA